MEIRFKKLESHTAKTKHEEKANAKVIAKEKKNIWAKGAWAQKAKVPIWP